jgi:hypothetical protein
MTAPASPYREFAAALQVPTLGAPAGLLVGDAHQAERRFAVHRNNFVVSLIDALAASFPVTQALVGVEFFRAMARARVLTDPPRSPALTDYALDFPGFVAAFTPAAVVPYLADVARIEALRIRAYHAADAAPVSEPDFRELLAKPSQLSGAKVVLHPACAWLRSCHAAYSIWYAHQGLSDLSDASLDLIDVDRAENALITRPQLDVATIPLPSGAIEWLDALRDGRTLGEAFGQAHASDSQVDDSALFALLTRHGLAIRVDLSTEN